MNFSIVHEFDTNVKTYWDTFLSPEFGEALMAGLKMKNYKVIERTDDGTTFKRVQSMEPSVALPALFAKLIPDMGYTEYDTLVWSTNTMKIRIELASMKDKIKTNGDYIVTALGDNRCRREFRGEVNVGIAFIGGKAEKFVVEQMKESYEVATRITREWLASHKTA
ncbi:MAG: DUF2505 domain-containing protein [Polyangia bacterium]